MSQLVPADQIEEIVGAAREQSRHIGRAVSAEGAVYILHSEDCRRIRPDLRDCPFSTALDWGIDVIEDGWTEDTPIPLRISGGRLVPE